MSQYPLLCLVMFCITAALPTTAQDDHQSLLEKVKQSREQERQHMAQREARFLQDRQSQENLLNNAKAEFERYQKQNNPLKQQTEQNLKTIESLKAQIAQRKNEMGDFESVINQMSRDFNQALTQSPISMQLPNRKARMDTLANADNGLNLERIEALWLLVQEEMTLAGQLRKFDAPVIAPDGTINQFPVQQIGSFSSYQQGRFLRYVPETQEFLVVETNNTETLSNQAFFSSEHAFHTLYLDPTGGSLLGILEWTPDWQERLEQGGIIGKIILALGAIGLAIIVWRIMVLGWQTQLLQTQLSRLESPKPGNSLGRILLKVKEHHNTGANTEALQLQIDEAVLNEIGSLERGQNILKLLAATAPLLGLLGTVTGMIITFQSISFFGSGDPKLMAGGISQALVTTVLGLIVAIPLLFGHSFISALSDNIIRRLEEQSAGLLARHIETSDT